MSLSFKFKKTTSLCEAFKSKFFNYIFPVDDDDINDDDTDSSSSSTSGSDDHMPYHLSNWRFTSPQDSHTIR